MSSVVRVYLIRKPQLSSQLQLRYSSSCLSIQKRYTILPLPCNKDVSKKVVSYEESSICDISLIESSEFHVGSIATNICFQNIANMMNDIRKRVSYVNKMSDGGIYKLCQNRLGDHSCKFYGNSNNTDRNSLRRWTKKIKDKSIELSINDNDLCNYNIAVLDTNINKKYFMKYAWSKLMNKIPKEHCRPHMLEANYKCHHEAHMYIVRLSSTMYAEIQPYTSPYTWNLIDDEKKYNNLLYSNKRNARTEIASARNEFDVWMANIKNQMCDLRFICLTKQLSKTRKPILVTSDKGMAYTCKLLHIPFYYVEPIIGSI